MNANLKLYAAVMGKHVPAAAYDALGDAAWNARALVVASHKGLAMRAAQEAGVKVNLNGWRIAAPIALSLSPAADVLALQYTRILFAPKPGDVLLSRRWASGFVARWHHGIQRWTRVAEFVDGRAVLLPGAVDEMLWDDRGNLWEIDARAWRARMHRGEEHGGWRPLDPSIFPRRSS